MRPQESHGTGSVTQSKGAEGGELWAYKEKNNGRKWKTPKNKN
jgi:hypothetical protein